VVVRVRWRVVAVPYAPRVGGVEKNSEKMLYNEGKNSIKYF